MTEQTNTDETSQCKLNLRVIGQTLMAYNTVAASSFGSLHWPLCVANSIVIGDKEKKIKQEKKTGTAKTPITSIHRPEQPNTVRSAYVIHTSIKNGGYIHNTVCSNSRVEM